MGKKIKVLTIVGTRPEIIKLSRVIYELDKYTEHILVHTGQNFDFELNKIFFDDLEIRNPDVLLKCAGKNSIETIAKVILESDKIINKYKPDALLIYGDTNSSLCAISAKRNKVPIFHMEAGNRCFDQRVPEEINRKIVDHLSDINMPISEHARNYLINEGINPQTIIKTGSSMMEVLNFYKNKINKSEVLKSINIKKNKFILISIHREENLDYIENLNDFIDTLVAIEEKYKKKIIISTHPRTSKKLNSINFVNKSNNIKFLKPFGFIDYIKLQISSFCVISDSGTITEESSILGFPAITIRNIHERPEGMDEGTLVMSGLNKKRVIESIDLVTNQKKYSNSKIVSDYNLNNVSTKVVRIILSYTDYVNKFIWKK